MAPSEPRTVLTTGANSGIGLACALEALSDAGAVASRSPRARHIVGDDAQAVAPWDRVAPTLVKDLTTRVGLGL